MALLTKLYKILSFLVENTKVIEYNKRSMTKHGWDLSWLGATNHEEALLIIRRFQRENNLEPDGMVGPMTFRRLDTRRESEAGDPNASASHIICNGEEVPIDWVKVVSLDGDKNLALSKECYKSSSKKRKPQMIVTHWDAALSAESCHRILKKRNISSHFVIDNDGTIYQMVDTNNVAWHAKGVNDISVGIDFSNAYYSKYQKWYTRKGFGRRPILENSYTHGNKHQPHLGYYQVQIDAYKELIRTLCEYYEIPVECPRDSEDRYLTEVHQPAVDRKYHGVVCHFNLTKRKIDCAGLQLDKIIDDIVDERD